jgi:hypothetical protein
VIESCDVHSGKNGLMTSAPSPLADERKNLAGDDISSAILLTALGEMEVLALCQKVSN